MRDDLGIHGAAHDNAGSAIALDIRDTAEVLAGREAFAGAKCMQRVCNGERDLSRRRVGCR